MFYRTVRSARTFLFIVLAAMINVRNLFLLRECGLPIVELSNSDEHSCFCRNSNFHYIPKVDLLFLSHFRKQIVSPDPTNIACYSLYLSPYERLFCKSLNAYNYLYLSWRIFGQKFIRIFLIYLTSLIRSTYKFCIFILCIIYNYIYCIIIYISYIS